MARKSTPPNGHTSLEEAMALLIQNQAAFLGRAAETDRRLAENEQLCLEHERRHLEYEREIAERFARIEAQMNEAQQGIQHPPPTRSLRAWFLPGGR